MKKLSIVVAMLLLVVMGGCSNAPKKNLTRKGDLKKDIIITQAKEFHETTGIGAPSENSKNSAQRKQTSYEAAKALAMKEMAEYLYGVKLDASTTVRDAMIVDSSVETEVVAFLRGVETVRKEWFEDDSCVVTLRLNIKEYQKRIKALGIK